MKRSLVGVILSGVAKKKKRGTLGGGPQISHAHEEWHAKMQSYKYCVIVSY